MPAKPKIFMQKQSRVYEACAEPRREDSSLFVAENDEGKEVFFRLNRGTYEEMNRPQFITVTVARGDRLNEENHSSSVARN